MSFNSETVEVLKETSRTFYLSIVQLPEGIKEAVMSSYLLLRAIDEIEDHPVLEKAAKIHLLRSIASKLEAQTDSSTSRLPWDWGPHRDCLPEVTRRIDEWLALSPKVVSAVIHRATSAMAVRMAYWVEREWLIQTKTDLDRYTFSVAGAVGLLLSDLWVWYDGTLSRRSDAIACGRGLQAVNILRNRPEDLARGIDFFPQGWDRHELIRYARLNLSRGDRYIRHLPEGPLRKFCQGPQDLAHATLAALEQGQPKLSRSVVLEILGVQNKSNDLQPQQEKVILVNEADQMVGVAEKIEAHRLGTLHRAFSIFVLNSAGKLLLQKRSATKYHSRNLWSNTCCGHPRPGETIEDAALRRLKEEMGFDTELEVLFSFIYHSPLEDGLHEHEYDHVLIGYFDGVPRANPEEVDDWKWMDLPTVRTELELNPQAYTYWFRILFGRFCRAVKCRSAPGTNAKRDLREPPSLEDRAT